MAADQIVKTGDALHPLGQSTTGQTCAVLVDHEHVVVGLSPVHPNKKSPCPSSIDGTNIPSPRTPAAG